MEVIERRNVRARKDHRCDLCGCVIAKGELHEWQKNKCNGELYVFRVHLHCQELSGKIWDYVDPDEGMCDDEFYDALLALASIFYCPFHCDEYEEDMCDCDRGFDADVCVRRFAKFMESRELRLLKDFDGVTRWRMVKVEGGGK